MSGMTFVEVHGKTFVSGLLWKPLRSARNYMREAKDIGRQQNMEMVAIRRGKVLQAGFAKKLERAPRGTKQQSMRSMYSLAASLAGTLGDNWIGAFDLGDGRYAFIAVHQGGIIPGKDLVAPREEVVPLFRETLADFNTEKADVRVIVSDALEPIFGGEVHALAELLNPKALKPEYRLKPLTLGLTGRQLTIGAIGLSILVAGSIGANAYFAHKAQQAEAEKNEKLRRLTDLRAKASLEQALAAIVRPWQRLPSTSQFTRACAEAWTHFPADVQGWTFTSGSCLLDINNGELDRAEGSYARTAGGTTAGFQTAAQAMGASGAFADGGQRAILARRLATSAPDSTIGAAALPVRADMRERLLSLARGLPPGVAVVNIADKEFAAPANAPKELKPDWLTYSLDITSLISADVLLDGFDGPGLRLTEITADVNPKTSAFTWHIKGEIYGH